MAVDFPMTFFYPPTYLLQLVPLALLSKPVHFAIYTLLGMILWTIFLHKAVPRTWFIPLFFLSQYSGTAFMNALTGQNSLINAGLLGNSILLLPTMPFISGVLLSLILYKTPLVPPILAFLLFGKHYKALAALCGGVLLQVLLTLVFFGSAAWVAYWQQLPNIHIIIDLWSRYNITAFSFFYNIGLPEQYLPATQQIFTFSITLGSLWAFYKNKNIALSASVLCFGLCIYAPYLMAYDIFFSMVGMVFFCRYHNFNLQKRAVCTMLTLVLMTNLSLISLRHYIFFIIMGYGVLLTMWALCVWQAAQPSIIQVPFSSLQRINRKKMCIATIGLFAIVAKFSITQGSLGNDFMVYRIAGNWAQHGRYADIYNIPILTEQFSLGKDALP